MLKKEEDLPATVAAGGCRRTGSACAMLGKVLSYGEQYITAQGFRHLLIFSQYYPRIIHYLHDPI